MMKNVSVSIAEWGGSRGKCGLLIYIPNQYSTLLGDYVRPEGTLASGLVLHCAAPASRGATYAVQSKPQSGRRTIALPEQFIGAQVTSPKSLTPINCEGELVDGVQVVIFDRLDPKTMFDRQPRKVSKRLPEEHPAAAASTSASHIEVIREAVRILRHRIRDAEAARALINLIELSKSEGVRISFNGTELRAVIEHDLFR